MTFLRIGGMTIILALAGACSGGSGNVTETELSGALNAFTDRFGAAIEADDFTDVDTLPSEGTASFAGFIGIAEDTGGRDFLLTEAAYASPMSIAIRLNSGEVSGEADAFVRVETNAALEGNLTLSGTFNRNADLGRQFPINGNLTGQLVDGDDRTLDIRGDFVADLYGDAGAGLSGDSDGSLTTRDSEGTIVTDETFSYDADIIATRDDLN